VFRDDLALPLAGEAGVAVAERLRAELSDTQLLSFSRWTSLRARGLDAVEQTLRSIASFAPATRVVLTYDVPANALSGMQREVRDAISRVVAQLGEPFVTAFEPIEIESLLVRLGYLDHEDELRIGGPQRLLSATVR